MKRVALAAAAALLLSACAATTYDEAVRVQRFDATTIQVSARGNDNTTFEQVMAYALRKAAEETISSGNEWFVVTGASDQTRTSSFTSPTQTFANANVTATGNTATGYAHSTTYGGNTYTSTLPGLIVTAQMGSGPKPANVKVYDAREVMTYTAGATQPK